MKKVIFLLVPLLSTPSALFPQCGSGACPPAAINSLPAGGLIAAGTTYCISGPVNNSTAYTVNGALIIQSGVVSVGDLTVAKTGSVVVIGGAQLMANSYTGDATAPAAVISNMTVCTNGYLYLSGAINQGETNFTVNDYGMFLIHGSWSTIVSDTWFRLGMGAIVEMCSSFTFKSSTGFFTETSTGPSYIVTRSAMANGAGSGYLSTSGAASQIRWTIPGGPVAWVTHPAANTCTGSSCAAMLPPGTADNGTCGSVISSFQAVLLPVWFLDVTEQSSGEDFFITAKLGVDLPAERVTLESATDGDDFSPTAFAAMAGADDRYRFTLPAVAARNYYRIRATGDDGSAHSSNVLPPFGDGASSLPGQVRISPDPATHFVNIYVAPGENFTVAVLINAMGQVLRRLPFPAGMTVVRCELPSGLPAGIYFIRLTGPGGTPVTARILKTP